MEETDLYLIWSHEHTAWWGPAARGYSRKISEAGRYTHSQALAICTEAIPGTSDRLGALPELPIRFGDIEAMVGAFAAAYPRFYMDENAWL